MPRRKADVLEETEAAAVMDEEFNEAAAEPEEQTLTDTEERAVEPDEEIRASVESELEEARIPTEDDAEADIVETVAEGDMDREPPEIQGESGNERPAARRERPSRRAREESRVRRVTAEQEEIANESALRSAVRTGRVLNGEVAAVEELNFGGKSQMAAIVVLEKKYKVTIPFSELFTVSPIDMTTVDLSTNDGRYDYVRRTRMFAERMIGGTIPFCITQVERDGNGIVMLGSRARAMERISRLYFGGDNPRYKIDDIVEATITSVNVHSIVVLVGGVDVVIPQFSLTRRWFLDLHDGYKVGETILARLENVRLNDSGQYVVSLDPISVEIENAKSRYNILSNGGNTKGIITNVVARRDGNGERIGMTIFAYIPSFDLFARVIRINANSFGRKLSAGSQVMLRVIDHAESGYLICEARYDFGNNSMFNSYLYR